MIFAHDGLFFQFYARLCSHVLRINFRVKSNLLTEDKQMYLAINERYKVYIPVHIKLSLVVLTDYKSIADFP